MALLWEPTRSWAGSLALPSGRVRRGTRSFCENHTLLLDDEGSSREPVWGWRYGMEEGEPGIVVCPLPLCLGT